MKTFGSGQAYERPRIRRTLQEIEVPTGDIYLIHSGSRQDLRIQDPDQRERDLLHALDGSETLAGLEVKFGPARVKEVVAALGQWGALEDAADDALIPPAVRTRFDRQLRYFSDVSSELPPSQCQQRLESATVAVLGVGGLGGWSALSLACCGIGRMIIADGDRVELTNLNRQVLYGEGDIGRLKVEVAAERLAALNSKMDLKILPGRLEGEKAIGGVIAGSDVVIDAIDWPAHYVEHWVNSACFSAGVPYISMSHAPPTARVGPFYVPGRTGCYACQDTAYRREYPLFDLMVDQMSANPSPAAVVGPACAHIGGHVALDLLHYLTDIAPPSTLGTAYVYDLRTMECTRKPIKQEPDCPVCGPPGSP
jgi:bacteriocin biosynthesis cyclodehydratase domain-containing protein